jgi:hypothetical protein
MAGGAGTTHVACVFDVDVVVQQGFANVGAGGDLNLCAFGAQFRVGEDFDNRHGDPKVQSDCIQAHS